MTPLEKEPSSRLTEIVIASGPRSVNGVRNGFLDIHVEMLRDAGIAARLALIADIGAENQAAWVSQGEFERYFVLVPESQAERARLVNLEVSDCRICLKCEAYIKPGLTKCPRCGVADERDPAELRAAYNAALMQQISGK
jgi:ribosomal protein L40E